MGTVQVKNNAYSTLASGITNSDSSLTVATGHGSRFPAVTTASGNYFYATLIDTSNNLEVVKVTNVSTDTFTITRAQDGTTARAYSANDRIELRVTSALLSELPTRTLQTGDLADDAVTAAKLADTAVTAGSYGGSGKYASFTVDAQGRLTAAAQGSIGILSTTTYNLADSPVAWTKPATGTFIRIQMWGGGGSGGTPKGSGSAGGGGGGGACFDYTFPLADIGSSATITIGAGGAAKTVSGAGNAGGNTTFVHGAVTYTAFGGGAGDGGSDNDGGGGGGGGLLSAGSAGNALVGGAGGTGNGGDGGASAAAANGTAGSEAIYGGGGGGGGTGSGTGGAGGASIYGGGGGGGGTESGSATVGGSSVWGGAGGAGATGATNATAGSVPGGGGGGAESGNSGAGAAGRCIITIW